MKGEKGQGLVFYAVTLMLIAIVVIVIVAALGSVTPPLAEPTDTAVPEQPTAVPTVTATVRPTLTLTPTKTATEIPEPTATITMTPTVVPDQLMELAKIARKRGMFLDITFTRALVLRPGREEVLGYTPEQLLISYPETYKQASQNGTADFHIYFVPPAGGSNVTAPNWYEAHYKWGDTVKRFIDIMPFGSVYIHWQYDKPWMLYEQEMKFSDGDKFEIVIREWNFKLP